MRPPPMPDPRYNAWLAQRRRAHVLRIAFDVTFYGVVIASVAALAMLFCAWFR